MGAGFRNAIFEHIDDPIGGIYDDDSFMGRVRSSRRRKKSKTHRRKTRHSSKRSSRKSSKGIKYTKNGQPYRILANGRARFIKGKRKK